MANDNNNINELVTDDDPTAELRALSQIRHGELSVESEASAATCGFPDRKAEDASIPELKADLKSRGETIERLQFDIVRLRGKWTGLETEIQAREEITENLQGELAELRETLTRKENLIKKRDQSIKSLKAEIRERNDVFGALQMEADDLRQQLESANSDSLQQQIESLKEELKSVHVLLDDAQHENQLLGEQLDAQDSNGKQDLQELVTQQVGQLANLQSQNNELRDRFEQAEVYADALRRQLQNRDEVAGAAIDTQDYLQISLEQANERVDELSGLLDAQRAQTDELKSSLKSLQCAHQDELRAVRSELDVAQDTINEQTATNDQLSNDLFESRAHQVQLETMLEKSNASMQEQIESLEKSNRKLRRESKEFEDKINTKSDAINCLLAELAKKTQQIESIGQIEDVIHEIDDRMSERIDERAPAEKDRLTRVLIGSVEGQELRFPLFKDRLTIGRTQQNDIQLKATYISRRHAVVVTEGDSTRVIDWGSKNGVFVNSRRVTEHFLKNGDVVAIGTAEFRYEERAKRDS
ncbi:MAG: FHA domain-containing protein [Gammaproteobacteria bacterium]|nr:FHA domain-containing protein [Gammaproteobacteria bacterium]